MQLAILALIGSVTAGLLYRAARALRQYVQVRASRSGSGPWVAGTAIAPTAPCAGWLTDARFAWFRRALAVEPTHHSGARSPWTRHETMLIEAAARELTIQTSAGECVDMHCERGFEVHDGWVRLQVAPAAHRLAPSAAAELLERHPDFVVRTYERLRVSEEWIPHGAAVCVHRPDAHDSNRIDYAIRGSLDSLARRSLLGAAAFGATGLAGLALALVWLRAWLA